MEVWIVEYTVLGEECRKLFSNEKAADEFFEELPEKQKGLENRYPAKLLGKIE